MATPDADGIETYTTETTLQTDRDHINISTPMEADSNVYMNLDPGSETTTDVRQVVTDDGTGTLMETYSSDNSNHTKSITLLREAVSLPYLMVKLPSKILVTVLLDSASSVNFVTKESLKAMPHTLGGIVSATIKTLS